MPLVTGGQHGATGLGNSGNQSVAQINWRASGFALCGQLGGILGSQAIERRNPALHQLAEQRFQSLLKPAASGAAG